MRHKLHSLIFLLFGLSQAAAGATPDSLERKPRLGENIQYKAEAQISTGKGSTPLWLNANKHGLSSLDSQNGYLRGSIIRPLLADSLHRWGMGYGLDVAVPYNYTSHIVVQQAFAEIRWKYGLLTLGIKEQPMQFKNDSLSSGSQTLGINARPLPEVRLALPEYWYIPGTRQWLGIKGHISYGVSTDGTWQEDFTKGHSGHSKRAIYHSKAGYVWVGNTKKFPLSIEMGLEMVCFFGGTRYDSRGNKTAVQPDHNLHSFWNAFIPGGSDKSDGIYANVEGNHLGSWMLRLNYDMPRWRASLYADHYFEDHSQMFFLDYDGYPEGDDFMKKEKKRYFRYPLKDIMVGAEVELKKCHWVRSIVLEYLYTKYQSGPIYHDTTPNMPDHLGGGDNYYNHASNSGYQHWGMVMGNPLYRSPLYNTDGTISVKNNRFVAVHGGISGQPLAQLSYRLLATWQRGWGTYGSPYVPPRRNMSVLLDVNYLFPKGWKAGIGIGADRGSILGDNAGVQLTVSKSGVFSFGKKKSTR